MTSRYDPPASQLAQARTAAAVSAAIAFVVYLRTMLPGVSVGDWAEMQFIPAMLGVPHPTGYPIYVLTGWLFSLVPIGSVAFRAGLLSVVAASGAVAALGPPDDGAVEDEPDEEQVEAVHLRERRLEPNSAAEREGEAGGRRDDRPHPEAARDEHRDRDRARRGRDRQQARPERDRPDR